MLDSFRSRLVLSNLLIVLLGLILVVVVFVSLLAARSTDLKRNERASQSRALAAQIEQLYRKGASSKDLAQEVDVAGRVLQARILVVGPNDRIVVDSGSRTPFSTASWHSLNQAALREQRSARIALNKSKSLYVFQSPIHGVYRHAPGAAVLLVARVSDVLPDLASLLV